VNEYEEYVNEQILKAKLEPKQEQTIVKAEQPENLVNRMIDRASKGDIDFDKPTREEQEAAAKAYSEAEAQKPQETVDSLFAKAKKGEI
jgi:hypothetical protein